jgi:hypothetical protein
VRADAARAVQPGIEKAGSDQGFDGVGEYVRAVAQARRPGAAAEAQRVRDSVSASPLGERLGIDELGAQAGECALIGVRKAAVDQIADAEAEHCVAEELEALIVGRVPAFVGVARMREGLLEVRRLRNQAESRGELRPVGVRRFRHPCPVKASRSSALGSD